MLFLSFAWFQHRAPGWNVNTRLALTFALVQDSSFKIDRFIRHPEMESGDVAIYEGHYYSDKIIGTSLAGVPALWGVAMAENVMGKPLSVPIKRYLVTVFSAGFLSALAGVLLFRLLVYWNGTYCGAANSMAEVRSAAFIAVAAILGSVLFLYGTLFMSYGPATFFLMAMLCLSEMSLARSGGKKWALIFLAALSGGFAVLCEYTYAAAVGVWCLLLAWRMRNVFVLLPCAVAGILALSPFVYYTMSIFGKPTIPYEHHAMAEFQTNMAQGMMGAKYPRLSVLWFISFHPYRGLFIHSPMLFLGCAGLIAFLRKPILRVLAGYCLGISVFYFLFNSAYYMWWGGWGFSPRHLAPAVPLLVVGCLYWVRSAFGRILITTTGLFGVAVHVMVNATEPQLPDGPWYDILMNPTLASDLPIPFFDEILPRFRYPYFDANLGSAFGLSPYTGLAVYGTVMAGLALAAIKMTQEPSPSAINNSGYGS